MLNEQRSASDWADQRESLGIETKWTTIQLAGKSLYSQMLKMMADYDDIIVDVGGRDTTSQRSALAVADVFLVPFKPRSLDIWTIGAVRRMLQEICAINPKLKSFAVINQADSKGSDNEDAINVLSENQELKLFHNCIGQRKAFSNAAADGLGVTELPKRDQKAIQEISDFYERLYGSDI
jgi:chromosome partitioning protein